MAATLGVGVRTFDRFKSHDCLDYVQQFGAEVVINVSGLYIPDELLKLSRVGVVGSHYAALPTVRGGDSVRWSILLDIPVCVCQMVLASQIDMGDILHKRAVQVSRGDTAPQIYRRCQAASAEGLLDVLDHLYAGSLTRTVQKKEDGQMFYRMGLHLKSKVDTILLNETYSHYA
jgi:methionyl-tRNA formyltransferase